MHASVRTTIDNTLAQRPITVQSAHERGELGQCPIQLLELALVGYEVPAPEGPLESADASETVTAPA